MVECDKPVEMHQMKDNHLYNLHLCNFEHFPLHPLENYLHSLHYVSLKIKQILNSSYIKYITIMYSIKYV